MRDKDVVMMLGELKGLVSSIQNQINEQGADIKMIRKEVNDNSIKQTNYMAIDLGEHKVMNEAMSGVKEDVKELSQLLKDRAEEDKVRERKVIQTAVVISVITTSSVLGISANHDKILPLLVNLII
jgi:hypothetical protein